MAALHITKENFEKEILQSEKTVSIDFCATWCGPCQMLTPVIEELSNEVTDAKICKINVDEQAELANKYHIMTIPTLVVIKNGQIVMQSSGVRPKSEILEMLK